METLETTPPTLAQFIAQRGITAKATPASDNPNFIAALPGSTHWRVTLRYGRRSMTTPFSQGSAYATPPTAHDVLYCLAADSSGFDNARSFEDWCADYGDNPDSRQAERTYKTIKVQRAKLAAFLGEDYPALLECQE